MTTFRNNTGNKGKQELIDGFVVRTKPFKLIFKEISDSKSNKPEQNYLIIGQRGAGKTTLLYRLKYEIEDKLTDKLGLLPIMLSEEQYNLTELLDLWQHVAGLLEDQNYFQGITAKMDEVKSGDFEEEESFNVLETFLQDSGKKLIIFIENIDAFFKKIGASGQKRLREILTTSHHIRLMGSATSFFEGVTDYSMPFYEFFKIIDLKGLTLQEAEELLLSIAEQYGEKEKIQNVIAKTPNRLESLRRLTGGNPRTITYLFDIFLGTEKGKAIKDLHKLLDDLTALYKSELDQLSPLQQKVVDAIARNWDAIAVKDITLKTRIESKQVSSILSALEKNQIIEVVNTKSKNNLYRIRERFMNIWYLMRFGKVQDKENVLWLVRFYDTWCDNGELANHINKHLKNLEDGKYDANTAVYMSNTFLACENVPEELRYSIYKVASSVTPKQSLRLLYSDKDRYAHIRGLIKQKKYDDAVAVLENTENQDDYYFNVAAFVYGSMGDHVKAEHFAEEYFKLLPNSGFAAFRIGLINEQHLANEEKAIKYYQIAMDLEEFRAAINLGQVYYKNDNLDKALEYYLIAESKGITRAFMPLATIYFCMDKIDLAREYTIKAVNANQHAALVNLGLLSEIQGNEKEAEENYKKALANNIDKALILLGRLEINKDRPNRKLAIDYLTKAYEKKLESSTNELAKAYFSAEEDEQKGIDLLKKESKAGDSSAAHTLAHFYEDKGIFEDSDRYFELSYQLGRKGAAICQSFSILQTGRIDQRKKALRLIEENISLIENSGLQHKLTYASILLWNDEIERSKELFVREVREIRKISALDLDKLTGSLLDTMTGYFIMLIAKGLVNVGHSIFMDLQDVDLKNIIKPVYYALMNYLKDEYPKEYLKAGDELRDTVKEIISDIEEMKGNFIPRGKAKLRSISNPRRENK